jgi:acetylornithine/N-succinyldiaminopimelate aminotransferase
MMVKERFNIFERGDQGGTYTGQPLGMAVGKAVLEELLKSGFLEAVNDTGAYIKECLLALGKDYEISNIRGLGLLIAFDLEHSAGSDVVAACLDDGLILNSPKESSIRLIPPLIATRADVDAMLEILLIHLKKR